MLLNEKAAEANERKWPLKKKKCNYNIIKRGREITYFAIKKKILYSLLQKAVLPRVNSCFNYNMPFRRTPSPVMLNAL